MSDETEPHIPAVDPRLLAAIIDYLPFPVFVKDAASTFVLSNRSHDESVGIDHGELIGRTTAAFLVPEDVDVARAKDLIVLETGEELVSAHDYTFNGNRRAYIEVRKARFADSAGRRYVLGVSNDLTAVRQRESHLRAITASVPVGIVEVIEGEGAAFANDLAHAYMQVSGAENPLVAMIEKLSEGRHSFPGEKQKFEITVGTQGKDVKRLLVRTSGWISIPYKNERSAVISLTDLSEVAELRRENDEINSLNLVLEDKLRQLREAQDELVKKGRLEQLGHLTATIAHELRNPLGAVSTSAFLLQRKLQDKNPGTEAQFARVANGVQRCNDIITQLLDFARTRQLDLNAVHLDDWLAELVTEEGKQLSEALNIFCELGLADAKVAMDASRMSRAIINLLHNAAEAMVGRKGQPIDPPTENPTIRLSTRRTRRGCEIEVTDNGPGMTPEVIQRIREPLFTTKNFGTGLGVPAVEKILEQHHGGLEIASEPGKGSRFTLWWPVVPGAHKAA
jgi:PAS domain S-box-containing protein